MKRFLIPLLVVMAWPAWADMYPDASNAKMPDAMTNLAITPHVATNALLTAASTVAYPNGVWRDDFTAGRGASPLWYQPSASPCSLFAGNGDNGSQVKSADSKCWLAVPINSYSPMQFGAAGNGSTNDNTPVQNAINAAAAAGGSGTVALTGRLYSVTALTLVSAVRIEGGAYGGSSGFQAGVSNANLITIPSGATGTVLSNFKVMAAKGGVKNTSGVVITNKAPNTIVEGLSINDACTAIEEDGNSAIYRDLKISSLTYDQTGCDLVTVGKTTTGGNTIGPRFLNMTINGQGTDRTHNAKTGFSIYDCGGCYFSNNDVLFTNIGTNVSPGAGQAVSWGFWSNTVVGDSTSGNVLNIDTSSNSGAVRGLQFNGSWFSAAGNYQSLGTFTAAVDVSLQNTGGGVIDGIHFNGSRFYSASQGGLVVSPGVLNVTVDASSFCGLGASGTGFDGIALLSGVVQAAIRNNTIIPNCDGINTGGNMRASVVLQGNNNHITITGNFVAGNGAPAVWASVPITGGATMVINNNDGLDNAISTVPSAATIDAGAYSYISLTGTTTVSNITSGWAGRKVNVLPGSGLNFAVGGSSGSSFCSSLTAGGGVLYTLTFIPGVNCWTHTP